MDLFEIECDEISGTANNGSGTASHAWNAVKLDGMWYYVDTTWGESWFMLSREEMAIDHFSDYYKTGRSESLSAEYLRRRYHISAGQTLTVAEVNAQIRLDMLAGKTELAYLVRGDYEFEKDWHFGDLTQAEYLTVYDQWSVHSYSSYRRGEYTVVRLIGG